MNGNYLMLPVITTTGTCSHGSSKAQEFHMLKKAVFPGKYIQSPGAITELPALIRLLGHTGADTGFTRTKCSLNALSI
jgi:hypothetical protein